jgi:beta-aspartyl-peptidase (threonine type)
MCFLQGLETVDNSYFITEDNVGMLKLAKEAGTILVPSCSPVTRSYCFLLI